MFIACATSVARATFSGNRNVSRAGPSARSSFRSSTNALISSNSSSWALTISVPVAASARTCTGLAVRSASDRLLYCCVSIDEIAFTSAVRTCSSFSGGSSPCSTVSSRRTKSVIIRCCASSAVTSSEFVRSIARIVGSGNDRAGSTGADEASSSLSGPITLCASTLRTSTIRVVRAGGVSCCAWRSDSSNSRSASAVPRAITFPLTASYWVCTGVAAGSFSSSDSARISSMSDARESSPLGSDPLSGITRSCMPVALGESSCSIRESITPNCSGSARTTSVSSSSIASNSGAT